MGVRLTLPSAGRQVTRRISQRGSNVSLVSKLKGQMSLPVIGAPMFIVGVPALVIEQCINGVIGSFPALNARPAELLDAWLEQIEARARSPSTGAARGQDRPLCRQPDHPSIQRPAGPRSRCLRASSGADDHYQPARAGRCREESARIWRRGISRRDQHPACAKGAGGGRGRIDPGLRRRRRPCRRAQPVRAIARSAPILLRTDRPVRFDHRRRRNSRGRSHGRGLRLHRHALHRDAGSQRRGSLQADDRRQQRGRCAVHAVLHRRARQLPQAQHRARGPRSGQSRPRRTRPR